MNVRKKKKAYVQSLAEVFKGFKGLLVISYNEVA